MRHLKLSLRAMFSLSIIFAFYSCTKTGVNSQPDKLTSANLTTSGVQTLSSTTDIYVVGFVGLHNLTYWKNGVPTTVSTTGNALTLDNITKNAGIAVSGSDVYIGDQEYDPTNGYSIKYWKNGIATILAQSAASTFTGIAVLGSNVYVIGYDGSKYRCWVNGTALPASSFVGTDSSNYAFSAITTAGNDVYICGTHNGAAVYWKNGIETALNNGSGFSPNGITIASNNVYVVGANYGATTVTNKYWVNSVDHTISSTSTSTYWDTPTGIAVNNSGIINITGFREDNDGNIYVSGSDGSSFNSADYNRAIFGRASAVVTDGSSFYSAGFETPNSNNAINNYNAKYWVSGTSTTLNNSGSFAFGIAIVTH